MWSRTSTLFTSSILHARPLYFPKSTFVKWRLPVRTTGHASVLKAIGAVGLGLGLSSLVRPPIQCEESRPASPVPAAPAQAPPPDAEMPQLPQSSVNVYELSFGTVAGICAGVFIKKGAKAVAFALGGVFVLLQYFGSFGVVKVDWQRIGTRFQHLFYKKDPKTGTESPPTVYSLWTWIVDFLTADFQPRASFIAGLVLGLRVG